MAHPSPPPGPLAGAPLPAAFFAELHAIQKLMGARAHVIEDELLGMGEMAVRLQEIVGRDGDLDVSDLGHGYSPVARIK